MYVGLKPKTIKLFNYSGGRILLLMGLILLNQPMSYAAETSAYQPKVQILNDGQLILEDVPPIPDSLVARLNQFQNVRSAGFLDWTEDGKGMYIRTRFGLISQIHRVYSPGGARHQLTFFKEPVGEVTRMRNGKQVALTMDKGGSEFGQIFLLDPSTTDLEMVSDGSSLNTRLVWERKGTRLAFRSTRRNGHSKDIWIMDTRNPEAAYLVVEAPDTSAWAPVDFSHDGKSLLVQQFIGATDSRIHVLDIESGELKRLVGDPESPSANRAITFNDNDEGFYFITNVRDRSAELAWQSLTPGMGPEFLTATVPWDVTEFAFSADGRRGAFTSNEGGISRLYLINTRTKHFTQVLNMPVGVISGLSFHPDSRRLAMTLSTAKSPSDVYVMKLGRSPEAVQSLERWTYSEVGGLDTKEFIEPELVSYLSADPKRNKQFKIPAFIYKPKGKGPFPVVIYIHGGPEAQYRPSFSSTFQMWLDELGVAVIAPNVRGSLGYGDAYLTMDDGMQREDSVKDIGALLDWIETRKDLDQSRVAVYGGSYGGYMVLASAVHYSDRLKAAIDVVGISNFVTFLENTQEYRRQHRRMEYGDERDPEMRAYLESISPLNHVDDIKVPLLVVQGQNDPRVPITESEQIVAAMRERDYPVWYINALNEGHGYERKENRDVFQQVVMMFLQRYLLGEETTE
jgi:dipeptidyl aminopeptidase/acylaminoacyl peptidase